MDADLLRVLDEAQARQLPALIADWWHAPGDRRWIARALRIDLALLTERPELAMPCIFRRCAFAGGEEERGIYATRSPIEATSLRALVRRWADAPHGPWLRALRPPPVPIDGAVIEEYRTSVRGQLWVSADGERIGVAGDGVDVTWDRATGRRLDGAGARPEPAPSLRRWYVRSDDDRLIFDPGGEHVVIACACSWVRTEHTLADDLVLVCGQDRDDADFFALVDLGARRVRWRREGRVDDAVARDAQHALVASRDGIATIDLATGETVAAWSCPYPHDPLPLPDGNLATRSGSVIRIWNVAEAIEREQVTHTSTSGWTAAAFSPDGTRLVTGPLLCDAGDGRVVARLRVDGPDGWLEGGPPRKCQRLCNGVFVELTPFGLTLWDSRDGRPLHQDRERRARLGSTVAFDPNGEHHAIWSERGTLQIFRLREGTLVRELEHPVRDRHATRTLGFSADGTLLGWEADGERFAIPLALPVEPRRLADDDPDPWEPEPARATIEDGLLLAHGVAIPIDDDPAFASPDGRSFASLQHHYRLAGAS